MAGLVVVVIAIGTLIWSATEQVKAFVQGVTAPAEGAISGAVVILARRALVDAVTVLIALPVLVSLLKVKRVPEPALITIGFLKQEALEEAIQAIASEVHRQYMVSFKPRAGKAGEYHAIRIQVKGHPELTAGTRAGYWAMP